MLAVVVKPSSFLAGKRGVRSGLADNAEYLSFHSSCKFGLALCCGRMFFEIPPPQRLYESQNFMKKVAASGDMISCGDRYAELP